MIKVIFPLQKRQKGIKFNYILLYLKGGYTNE